MAKTKKDKDSKLEGMVVNNSDVAAAYRKHGPPTFTKPHGANKTILYYPNPDYEGPDDGGDFKDHAGEDTGGALRTRVIHKGRRGTRSSSRRLVGGTGKPVQMGAEDLGNPNREAENASLVNKGDLDKEIVKIEEDAKDPQAKEVKVDVADSSAETTADKVEKVSQDPVKTDPSDVELKVEKKQAEARKEATKKSSASSKKSSSSKK